MVYIKKCEENEGLLCFSVGSLFRNSPNKITFFPKEKKEKIGNWENSQSAQMHRIGQVVEHFLLRTDQDVRENSLMITSLSEK